MNLKSYTCFSNLPKDARIILKTKLIIKTNMRVVNSGMYYHFGLKNGIEQHFSFPGNSRNEILLVIGIDGLPIFKSTNSQFWTILGYIRPFSSNDAMFIGIYMGTIR